MDERRDEAIESIRFHVWSGYYAADETFDIIDDEVFECDGENDDWLPRTIRKEFKKKSATEQDWSAVTDCDRLDQSFASLCQKGILTRHRCGITIQDGLEVIEGIYQVEREQHPELVGYCFYHLQDMEAAMWGNRGLSLAFGCFTPSQEQVREVGWIVHQEFVQAGFVVSWDGTIQSRILLVGFRWQRRFRRS